MKQRRSLADRLIYAYGRDAMRRGLEHIVSLSLDEPLKYLTSEGKIALFKMLENERKFTNRINTQNRARTIEIDEFEQQTRVA